MPPQAPGPAEEGLAVQLHGLVVLPGAGQGTSLQPSAAQTPVKAAERVLSHQFPELQISYGVASGCLFQCRVYPVGLGAAGGDGRLSLLCWLPHWRPPPLAPPGPCQAGVLPTSQVGRLSTVSSRRVDQPLQKVLLRQQSTGLRVSPEPTPEPEGTSGIFQSPS